MEKINLWIDCILVTIILIGIIEIIVPEGETQKFVFLITGIVASIVIATPIIKLLSSDFSIEDVFKIDSMEDSFYYIDTLRSTVDRQTDILEEVFSGNVVERFNSLYKDMELSECKISFLHDTDGKIIEISEVEVRYKRPLDDINLLKKRVAEICEVDTNKVRVI